MANRNPWGSNRFKRETILLAWICSIVLLNGKVSAQEVDNSPVTNTSDFCPTSCRCYGSAKAACESNGLDEFPQNFTESLRQLQLYYNEITQLRVGDFDSYPYLDTLSLGFYVSDIEMDALKTLEYLEYLFLSKNLLTKVPLNLPSSLEYLDMEQNKLKELPDYCFKGLVNLTVLKLSRNEIHSLAPCAFCDLVTLKSLHLDYNPIENVTGVLSNLKQLETLYLSENYLKTIESRFFDGLTNLKTLELGGNLIENLTGALSNLTMLEFLSISKNNLTFIDSQFFCGLSNLKSLEISNVPTSVKLDESIFDSLKSLTILHAFNSPFLVQSIIKSTHMLQDLSNIQELFLHNNRIVNLREDFPSFFPRLKHIDLSGNLWHCDEGIKWLFKWLKESSDTFRNKWGIRCASPANIAFRTILNLNEKDFQTLTTERSMQTEYSGFNSSSLKTEHAAANADFSIDDLQTEPTQSRVATSPRLPIPKEVKESHSLDRSTRVTIPTVLANGCFVLVAVALMSLFFLRHKCTLVTHCNMHGNTSHCPQNEKVTMLSLSERTIENEYENL